MIPRWFAPLCFLIGFLLGVLYEDFSLRLIQHRREQSGLHLPRL